MTAPAGAAAWLQLTLEAVRHSPEQLEDALLAAGAVAVTLVDGADDPVLEPAPGQTPLWPNTRVTGLFPAQVDVEAVKTALTLALGDEVLGAVRLEGMEDRDWVRAWMDDFHPMRFGQRLWICPGETPPPDPDAVNLLLDPGLAFGTGTHPTTRLCLEWLDAHPPVDRAVVDYGCGSGVLAIAAALLGAASVRATDIDLQALAATRDNAVRNGVNARLRAVLPEHLDDTPADLVVANILAGPLAMLAPRLAALAHPGGDIVLAGVLEEQYSDVRRAYARWFDFTEPQRHEDWVRLHGVRNDRPV